MKNIVGLLALLLVCVSVTFGQDRQMFVQDVSWSPDGRFIAFTGLHDYVKGSDNFKTDVYLIHVDGTGMTKITDDSKNEYYTSLSKKRVAYSAKVNGAKTTDVYTADYDGSDVRRLTQESGDNSAPAFSPDGKRIAFASTRDGAKYQIYVMKSDGTDIKRLTNDAAVGFFNPQWSRDGKRLVYYAEKGDSKDQVWTMKADGSEQKLLTANIAHNIYPGWTPDGRIIFSSSKRDTTSRGSYVAGSFLYVINADGTGLKKLGDIKSFFARISPDGKKMAYVSGGFPQSSIYVANADGSGPVKITP